MIINKNSILYFSGTGNTCEVSQKIGKRCGFEGINIGVLDEEEPIEINTESIGIAFPVYYGGMPRKLNRVLSRIKSLKTEYIFGIATYGGMPGDPFKLLDNKLKEKGCNLSSGFFIKMPGNYILTYGAASKNTQAKYFKNADKKIEEIEEAVISRKKIPYEVKPYILGWLFSKNSERKLESLACNDRNFYADDKCTECGTCIKICPVNNITLENRNVKWHGKCEMCMSCIQYCPKEAIQYGSNTLNRTRYRNPNIDYLKELLRK